MALLDTHGDLEMDDEDLDEIFYPGSEEEEFVVEEDGNEGDGEGGSEPSPDSDQGDPRDLHR